MEAVMVGMVVGMAIFYVARGYYRQLKATAAGGCTCRCSACSQRAVCADSGQGKIMDKAPGQHRAFNPGLSDAESLPGNLSGRSPKGEA